ncbi:uncharacterized protein TNCV_1450391 [Trichonephila clavipes]|nr:uncharacterized protein TNCV_1450391 [Trichonephila clavipes]
MSVGCLMLVIIEEIGEILKWFIDQIMVEMIIGVAIRTTVKEISGSRAGIGFKTMIADLTIGDINLEIEVKMMILVDGTKEIGVRVKILVELMGRLNVLKVNDIKGDQAQSINQSPIKLSAICMSPVELPYVPILLDETFTKALWNTGAEKSFTLEETYQKYFYKQVKKSSTQVITAQGAKCRNMGVVELNIRIRDFEKPWLFHVLADLEYPGILGVDFIGGSKIILDFDRKSLAILDSRINKVVKTVEIEKVERDLSKTKLEEKQKRELQDLFNSFQGLFSDKPGLTHVLYHEIDTGDNPLVVSRPYRYDRLKQEILDYHVERGINNSHSIPVRVTSGVM